MVQTAADTNQYAPGAGQGKPKQCAWWKLVETLENM
jgi:hypothetical protein